MRNYDATKAARRYVAACAATILDQDSGHGNDYLYEDADDATVRRREKALARLVARLRREAMPPAPARGETGGAG